MEPEGALKASYTTDYNSVGTAPLENEQWDPCDEFGEKIMAWHVTEEWEL